MCNMCDFFTVTSYDCLGDNIAAILPSFLLLNECCPLLQGTVGARPDRKEISVK